MTPDYWTEYARAQLERPIIFSGAMVRAILEGRKTQTRRILKPVPVGLWAGNLHTHTLVGIVNGKHGGEEPPVDHCWTCPYGKPGDRLWMRENGWERPERSARDMREGADTWKPYYFDASIGAADHEQFKEWGFKRRPSIHMPRWASRITLEVTGVRVERLQDRKSTRLNSSH